jgi:hypothetical protein
MRKRKPSSTNAVLLDLLDKTLVQHVPELFYGPDASFVKVMESDEATVVVSRFEEIDSQLRNWVHYSDLKPRWELIRALASFKTNPNRETAKRTLPALQKVNCILAANKKQVVGLSTEWCTPYRQLLTKFFPAKRTGSPELFCFLDFAAKCFQIREPNVVRESTNLLVAKSIGRVLKLVAERVPGPPGMVSPGWWNLGLIPFEQDNAFVRAIHRGFGLVVEEHQTKSPWRLRWWLEQHPDSRLGWFDAVEEGDSIEAAAACLAKALFDGPDRARPLLDAKVAISVTISNPRQINKGPSRFDELKLGRVGFPEKKIAAAELVGLTSVIFAKTDDPADQDMSVHKDGHHLIVRRLSTLGEAYDELLVTSSAIYKYKQLVCEDWSGSTRGKWLEFPTPMEFTNSGYTHSKPRRRIPFNGTGRRSVFLLGQPFWIAKHDDELFRWELATHGREPDENTSKSSGAVPSSEMGNDRAGWERVHRKRLLKYALTDGSWHRVGLICGAGLGKTTNLKWLHSAINAERDCHGGLLAYFVDLNELPADPQELLSRMATDIANRTREAETAVSWQMQRLRAAGRIVLLLDGLDQAGPAPRGQTMHAVANLLEAADWRHCRIWLSGRPYAFHIAREILRDTCVPQTWQFVRVGLLDEAECRFLVEAASATRHA